jgi:hypothetical protein
MGAASKGDSVALEAGEPGASPGAVAVACDEVVEALCAGTARPCFGLFAAVAHPPAASLRAAFAKFCDTVLTSFRDDFGLVPDEHFSLYKPDWLHASIATFHHFDRPLPAAEEAAKIRAEWSHIVKEASGLPSWPSGPGRLRVTGSRLDPTGAGYLTVEDSPHMQKIRACIRQVTSSQSAQLRCPAGAQLRVPRIYHMTCLRWRVHADLAAVPRFADLAQCFERAWAAVGTVTVPCDDVVIIEERLPYMWDARVTDTLRL